MPPLKAVVIIYRYRYKDISVSSVQKALQGVKYKYKKIFAYDELQAICQSNQFSYFEIPTRGLTLINKSGYLFAVFNVEEAMNAV